MGTDRVDEARCTHGSVASCPWCIVRKQGDELLRLRAALRAIVALEPVYVATSAQLIAERALDGSDG